MNPDVLAQISSHTFCAIRAGDRYDELSYKDSSTLADGSAVEAGEYRPSHTQQLIKDNQMGTPTPVDLFITNEWGKGVLAGAASPPAEVGRGFVLTEILPLNVCFIRMCADQ